MPCCQVVVCESHSVAGGAAHCWSRRGCHFDSGTALFFGLPAAASSNSRCSSAAQSAVSAGLAAADMAAAEGGQGSVCTAGAVAPGSSDNPLTAVLRVVGEPLDLITYGPERTCLVFPEGSFRAQVSQHAVPRGREGGGVHSYSVTCLQSAMGADCTQAPPACTCCTSSHLTCCPSYTVTGVCSPCMPSCLSCRLAQSCFLVLCISCGVIRLGRSGSHCSSSAGE